MSRILRWMNRKWALIGSLALLLLTLLTISRFARPVVYLSQDMNIYQDIGERVWQDDFLKSEYPPLATTLFGLLASPGLPWDFPTAWMGLLIAAICAASLYAWFFLSPRDGVLFLLSALLTMVLLGLNPTWGRYDLLVGILIALVWMAHRRGHTGMSAFFVVLAGALKIVPFVLLPFLYLSSAKDGRKRLLWCAAGGILLSAFVSIVVLGVAGVLENTLYFLSYHAERGTQAESTWSGIVMLSEMLQGKRATIEYLFSAHQNMEVWERMPFVSMVLGILGLLGFFFIARKKSSDLGLVFLGTLSWLFAVSTVLSPQYIAWILPLLIFWSIERGAKQSFIILGLGCTIALLSHWLYPSLYFPLLDQDTWLPVIVLNMRNALLFILAGVIMRYTWNTGSLLSSGRSSVG